MKALCCSTPGCNLSTFCGLGPGVAEERTTSQPKPEDEDAEEGSRKKTASPLREPGSANLQASVVRVRSLKFLLYLLLVS